MKKAEVFLIAIILIVLSLVLCGCEDENYFRPEVQVSDCNLDGDDFVGILRKENGIDVNSFYRIECPKCPSGNWQNGCGYNEVKFGAYCERTPDGVEMCLFYGVPEGVEDIPAGTYCGQCGYQVGHDWTIFEIDPNEYIEAKTDSIDITWETGTSFSILDCNFVHDEVEK